jgi:uncharacterized phosphosugar-binding protein
MSVFDTYFAAIRQAFTAIEQTQLSSIASAADRFARTISAGRLVHVFGTGHSRMAVEEVFPRYGSFPGFHPIVELSMTYHNQVVGANGQRQAMFLENVQAFGSVMWRNFSTSSEDCLLAISSSGANAVTVDVAIEARKRGMFTVGLTSIANARASTPKHESGRLLHEAVDLVLDHHAPPGDAVVPIAGLRTPVAPISSVTSCLVVNLIKTRVAELLTENDRPPLVLTAACHVGEEESKRLFEAAYDDYRRRIGVLYQ